MNTNSKLQNINTEDINFIGELFKGFVYKNWKWYLAIFITLIAIPIQQLGIPRQYGNITGQIQQRSLGKAKHTLLIIVGLWIIVSLLDIGKSYIIKTLWPRFSNYCREEMLKAILTKYSHHYEAVKIGLIQSKINDVPWVLDSSFNLVQKILFENVILIISTLIYLWLLNWKLATIFILGVTLLAVISWRYIQQTVPHVQATEGVYQDYFEEISELLSNMMSIFANNKEDYNVDKIQRLINSANTDYTSIRNLDTVYKTIYYIVCLALFLGLLWAGLYLYSQNQLTSAQLVTLFIISYTLLQSLMIFYYNSKDIIINKGAIDVINNWYNSMPRESSIVNTTEFVKMNNKSNLDIDIRDLWFRYCSGTGGHANRCAAEDQEANNTGLQNSVDTVPGWLYSGLNLRLVEGEHVVVTGHIGSGKSTFAKILIRLHSLDKENSRGHIFFGGQDISNLDPKWIRQMVTYTPQKTGLFNDTLWNNIKYGIPESRVSQITPQHVLNLLRKVGLDTVADRFAYMMHKPVGKLGERLSGGQQQIIWLLRAMFNNSRWVILDEPTNNLDPESSNNVKKLIQEIQAAGKTTIIITHDESVNTLGSRHIVFIKGRIASDTHRTHN